MPKGRVRAGRILLNCAIEHAQRLIDSLGRTKVQPLSDLLRRLDRDLADCQQRMAGRS